MGTNTYPYAMNIQTIDRESITGMLQNSLHMNLHMYPTDDENLWVACWDESQSLGNTVTYADHYL
jgi:hypothetical protein